MIVRGETLFITLVTRILGYVSQINNKRISTYRNVNMKSNQPSIPVLSVILNKLTLTSNKYYVIKSIQCFFLPNLKYSCVIRQLYEL